MEGTVKDPTARETCPEEAIELAVNLTLVKDQEAELVKEKDPVPEIGTPETVNQPEDIKVPNT